MLSELRFVVFEATGGAAGIHHVNEVHPDVIFLDVRMPEVDGFEVLDKLKDSPSTAAIPVVIYTASVLTEAERARLGAASSIVPKESSSRQAAVENIRRSLQVAGLGVGS